MKLYKTLTIFLFNVFDIISATNQKNTKTKYKINSNFDLNGTDTLSDISNSSNASNSFLNFSLVTYGNWCGPLHGGYQDCCNKGPCNSCNIEDGKPTKECLEECEPIDKLDHYCAIHDQCCLLFDDYPTNQNRRNIECFPEGNYCYCDCELVKQSYTLYEKDCNGFKCKHYLNALKYIFENVVSCWYTNTENIQMCNKNNENITDYCNNDNLLDITE
jgi:hypothetical protein